MSASIEDYGNAVNRHLAYKRVIEDLKKLSASESDPDLRECSRMSAGDLEHFLKAPKSPLQQIVLDRSLPSTDGTELYDHLRNKEYRKVKNEDKMGIWLLFKQEVERQLFQGVDYFDEKQVVRGSLHRIQLEVNRVKSLLKLDF